MMTYLASYRSGSEKYGNSRGKAFKLPDPYKPLTKPGGANDNAPRPANDNTRKVLNAFVPAGRRLLSKYPYFKAAMHAWDIFRFIHGDEGLGEFVYPITTPSIVTGGWTLDYNCTADIPTHYRCFSGFCNAPDAGPVCFGSSVFPNATTKGINELNDSNACRMYRLFNRRHWTANSGLYALQEQWWKNSATSPSAIGQRYGVAYRRLPKPSTLPSFSPFILPIQQPLEMPLPMPWALAPYRANDPIGSIRTYGGRQSTVPRAPPVKPPPPGTKEVKFRSRAVVVLQALHHATTEGLDSLDAIHDALPKKLQAKKVYNGKWWAHRPQDKAKAIYDHFDQLDWNEAVKNLVVNHLEDKIIGTAAAKTKKALDNAPGGRIVGGAAMANWVGALGQAVNSGSEALGF